MNRPKDGPPSGRDENADKAEPKYLKPDKPGECPKPSGCICTWFPVSLGWTRGANKRCTAH